MSFTNRGSLPCTVYVTREPDRSGNFVCDGTADDVQIQAATDYVEALGGGVIFFGAGTFNFAANVNLKPNVSWRGTSRFSTIFSMAGYIIDAVGGLAHHCELTEIKFVQNNLGSGVNFACINITWMYHFVIDRCDFENADHEAIAIGNGAHHIDIKDCHFLNSETTDVMMREASYTISITNCRSEEVGGQAFEVYGVSNDVLIADNQLYNSARDMIVVQGGHDVTIDNNIIRTTTSIPAGYAIRIGTESGDDSYNINITNNNIQDIDDDMIYICNLPAHDDKDIYNIIIDGNTMIGSSGKTNNGIHIDSRNDRLYHIIVSNNIIRETSTGFAAILLENATRMIILGNSIDGVGVTTDGIKLDGTSNCIVNDNSIEDIDSDGIYVLGNSNDNDIDDNKLNTCDRYGINISVVGCNSNRALGNSFIACATSCINDAGTDTVLPFLTVEAPNFDSNIGDHPSQQMPDGVDTVVRFGIPIPLEFQEAVTAQVVLVPAGTGNMRRSVATDFGKVCAGEAYNTHTDAIAAGEVAVTQNELECIDILNALDGIAAGDRIGVVFTREGSHANDTVGATVHFLYFRLRYV